MFVSELFDSKRITVHDRWQKIEFDRITIHSKEAVDGAVFFALEGSTHDGHQYIGSVLDRGAVAVVVNEKNLKTLEWLAQPRFAEKIIVIKGDDREVRKVLGQAASLWFSHPSKKLLICAVTGTNGKTTSTYLLEKILSEWGMHPAVIGTVENRLGDFKIQATHTTPDAIGLQNLFQTFLKQGARSIALEVSSHALDQYRVWGTVFEGALFTNLTQDHLDYHSDMESYFLAKSKLFLEYPVKTRVIHADDPYGARLVTLCLQQNLDVLTFGKQGCNVNYGSLHSTVAGIEGFLEVTASRLKWSRKPIHIRSSLMGQFNIQNIAGVVALAIGMGVPPEKIMTAIAMIKSIPGRMQAIENKKNLKVVVDYAHTPDALQKALECLRPLTRGKLCVVFGCAGDRDSLKRPLMGAVAERFADEVWLTSDNPRTEDPMKIMRDVSSGFVNASRVHFEVDRRRAIVQAIANLTKTDLLLIAGKGHEDYQILGEVKTSFDDREVARNALS